MMSPLEARRRFDLVLDPGRKPLASIRAIRELATYLEEMEALRVREAKKEGLSWRQIANGTGIPFQTLFRRYGGPDQMKGEG